MMRHDRTEIFAGLALLVLAAGCTRTEYRRAADADVTGILAQKDAHQFWDLPPDAGPYPDPRSRFYDPTPQDHPVLPVPAPQLDAYHLPPLKTANGAAPAAEDPEDPELIPRGAPATAGAGPRPLPPVAPASPVRLASAVHVAPQVEPLPAPETGTAQQATPAAGDALEGESTLRIAPIPTEAWQALPPGCLQRMSEFESVREEYRRTFGPGASLDRGDDARELTLENLVELALINSREYQTRKEILYRVALRLTIERYQYGLNPVPFGNGTAIDYRETRFRGETVGTVNIPTSIGFQKALVTGGDFLARFANDVVLTFNGPQGFAADVGSELLFDFQQTVFQRDVQFEALTQAERDVVYAARDFIRFRKSLFRDIAGRYYGLLLSYRSIEIDTQDYFSNLRAFLQGQAEYQQTGQISRIQVDQFEQNALRSRSSLVSSCNNLETSLDRLKLLVGLPPEMDVHLDLAELEELTLRDEATVARELISRTRRQIRSRASGQRQDATALLGGASVLTDRMRDIARLERQIADRSQAADPQRQQLTGKLAAVTRRLAVLESAQAALEMQRVLESERAGEAPAPYRIFRRTTDVIQSRLELIERTLALLEADGDHAGPATLGTYRQRAARFQAELEQLDAALAEAVDVQPEDPLDGLELDELPQLVSDAEMLRQAVDELAGRVTAETPLVSMAPAVLDEAIAEAVNEVVQLSDQLLQGEGEGLPEVEADPQEAMLTALVQRLDLMNRRGELADRWREIKYAGDDLRSILDLQATHRLRTRSDINTPFGFTFDDSETRLRASLDTPLNRRAQRNAYRLALIDYNAARRALIESEDNVKFDIREDLRQLQLDRVQYEIAIASAALAYERVVSTRLQLQLGQGDVVARDFLEAQQAYTASLNSVAQQHIAYVLDRIELFFDLEGFETNAVGFWPELRDEDLPPPVNLDFPGTNPRPYGELVPGLWYSKPLLQMEQVPPGHVKVFSDGSPHPEAEP